MVLEEDANEKKLLFIKCKKSVQEIIGWKAFIFLPQNNFWRSLILSTVIINIILCFLKCVHRIDFPLADFTESCCDLLYMVDAVLAMMHFTMVETRKLRHGKRRHIVLIVIDCFSLIPLPMVYDYILYNTYPKDARSSYFRVNVLLRIYQIPKIFSELKSAVYKLKIYFMLAFLEVLSYVLLLNHFFSCIIVILFDEEQKERCDNDIAKCVVENELITMSLLVQCFIPPHSNFHLEDYKLFLIIVFFLGYFLTFGFIIPVFLFVSLKCLSEFFEYTKRWRQLKILVKNMAGIDKKLKKKIYNYFRYAWARGKADKWPEILNVFPLSFKKNIFCDLHWDAIRHSELLRSLSLGCKRSMALYMKTEFLLPGTVLLQKEQLKTLFIYLESGMLQIMSVENSLSPVINFSSGTVLGEMSLFLHGESQGILQAAQFSVVHFLSFRDFFQVLSDYPKDLKRVFKKFYKRIQLAKSTYTNKVDINPYFSIDNLDSKFAAPIRYGNIKWIKQQYQALSEFQAAVEKKEMYSKKKSSENEQTLRALHTQLNHTSVNLPLICVTRKTTYKLDNVCLKDSFPWMLNPRCSFLTVWKIVISIIELTTVVLYVAVIGWFPYLPLWFFNISILVSFVYAVDVLIQLFTAVKIKDTIVSKFSSVVFHRLSNLNFHIDVLAALPIQLFTLYEDQHEKRFQWNLYFVNTLLKTYQLIPHLTKWSYNPNPGAFIRSFLKYVIMISIIIYWSAAVFSLFDIECIFYECSENDWYKNFEKTTGNNNPVMASFFRAMITVLDISGNDFKIDVYESFIVFMCIYIFCRIFFFAVQAECIATYILEFNYVLEYKALESVLYEFMGKHKKIEKVRDRMMKTLQFHWDIDKGSYLTQNSRVFDELSSELKKEIDMRGLFQVLTDSRLLESEDDYFKQELCKKGVSLALPASSLLVTLGAQPNSFYLIEQGFVQVNSFTSNDLKMSVSTPIILSKSDAFPVVEAFSQTPSAVSAIAVTDCKLIVFELEDFLSTVMMHGALKDFVDAIKETDLSALSTAKLGVTPIGGYLHYNLNFYEEPFKKLKYVGTVLRFLLKRNSIDSNAIWYIRWELCRILCILVDLISWPMVLAFCTRIADQLTFIYILLIIDWFWCVDFYIRFHVAFYNKRGIYVVHPLATALHYLETSFLVDFIAFFPNFHFLYLLIIDNLNFDWYVGAFHVLARTISIYRIVGFMQYLKDAKKIAFRGKLLLFIIFVALGMHFYLTFMVHFYLTGVMEPNLLLPDDTYLDFNLCLKYYFNEVARTLSMFFRKVSQTTGTDLEALIAKMIWAILGYLTQIYVYSHLTLSSLNQNKNLTAYRYRMKSFTQYLYQQKIAENIASLAEDHFEHEWMIQKGYDLHKIFSRFPRTLHADVMFPLYKKTLQGIPSLLNANESFHKSLSRKVKEIYLQKGSVIIYEKQVQGNIFFVHKGKCYVEKLSKVLHKGSIIGHLKSKKCAMKNTIIASTHVKLLKLSWEDFFSTIVDFYSTKTAFESEAAQADDFIESFYTEEQKVLDSISLKKRNSDAYFTEKKVDILNFYRKKEQLKTIDPNSMKYRIITLFFVTAAYVTGILTPIFISIRLFSPLFLAMIYCLDVIWVVKILVTMKTGYHDKLTGNYISNTKAIIDRYLRSFDGLIIHILSILPFELIPLAHFGRPVSSQCCKIMSFCYANRLLRMIFVYNYMHGERNKLRVNFYKNFLGNLMRKIAIITFCVGMEIGVNHQNKYKLLHCYWSLDIALYDVLLSSYLCVIDIFVGSGIEMCESKTFFELVFRLIISLWALISKATFLNQILTVMYVAFQAKSDKMLKLQELEKYLLVRDVSPVLFNRIKNYFCDLIDSFNEGAEPSFLNAAPPFIKTTIMQELYTQNLSNCYAFQNLDEFFVKQLAERLERNIFFPGDYIVEKGDVDHNMYFIHKGEVYCIEADKKYKALELEVDLLVEGEYFGVLQGIFLSRPHSNTYRAKTLVDLLLLNYHKWADMREVFPDIAKLIYKKCMKYDNLQK